MRERFVGLDGLRGVAALLVVTVHLPDPAARTLFPSAHLAVDFFFMLSGFVLAHAYLDKLEAGMSVLAFMGRRVLRLYPLYLLALLLGAAFFAALVLRQWTHGGLGDVAAALLGGAFYLPVMSPLSPGDAFPLNVPAWSLFWELAANLVLAVTALQLRRGGLAWVIGAGVLALWSASIAHGGLSGGSSWSNFLDGGARVGFSLFVGVALCKLLRAGALPRLRAPPALLIAILVATLATPIPAAWRSVCEPLLVGVLLPMLIVLSAHNEPRGALADASAWAGRMSYGFYVLQMPIIMIVSTAYNVGADARYEQLGGVGSLLLIGLILASAWAADRFYDAPVRRRLRPLLVNDRQPRPEDPRLSLSR